MEKDLLALVQKNLPEMAAQQFSEYFKASEETKRELKNLTKENEKNLTTIEKLQKELDSLIVKNNNLLIENNSWQGRADSIEKREKDQYMKDKDHEIALLQKDVSAGQLIYGSINEFVKTIFNNVTIRENVTKNVVVKNGDYTQDVYGNNGTTKVVVGGGDRVDKIQDEKITKAE